MEDNDRNSTSRGGVCEIIGAFFGSIAFGKGLKHWCRLDANVLDMTRLIAVCAIDSNTRRTRTKNTIRVDE